MTRQQMYDILEPIEAREGTSRLKGWMENPFIGKDGRDYHSHEALQAANDLWARTMLREV